MRCRSLVRRSRDPMGESDPFIQSEAQPLTLETIHVSYKSRSESTDRYPNGPWSDFRIFGTEPHDLAANITIAWRQGKNGEVRCAAAMSWDCVRDLSSALASMSQSPASSYRPPFPSRTSPGQRTNCAYRQGPRDCRPAQALDELPPPRGHAPDPLYSGAMEC
jgi:hypothetical protein